MHSVILCHEKINFEEEIVSTFHKNLLLNYDLYTSFITKNMYIVSNFTNKRCSFSSIFYVKILRIIYINNLLPQIVSVCRCNSRGIEKIWFTSIKHIYAHFRSKHEFDSYRQNHLMFIFTSSKKYVPIYMEMVVSLGTSPCRNCIFISDLLAHRVYIQVQITLRK